MSDDKSVLRADPGAADVKPIFETDGFRRRLTSASFRRVPAGGEIIVQGRQGKAAFFIASGEVEVLSDTPYGAVRLATLASPRLVGEVGALAGLPRTASIRALTDVSLYRVERDELIALGREEPDLLLAIIAELGRQVEGFNRAISLYANALSALERREFDSRILEDLKNPPPQTAAFTQAFRSFADQIVSKRQQEAEMASAAAIQRSLLPSDGSLALVAHRIDLHATIRPARDVGGDFYDFFCLDDNRVVVCVGDVCGKGLPASLFAAIVVTVLRTTLREEEDLGAAVARANTILCRDNAASLFATLFVGVLHLQTMQLEYCNCGHNPPLLVLADGVLSLPATGIPIAMLDDRAAAVAAVELSTETTLVLYSDGVTEALNKDGEEFGDERLMAAVAGMVGRTTAEVASHIVEAADAFAGEAPQADDITCLVLRPLNR